MVTLYVIGVFLILGVFWLLRSRGSDVSEMPRPSAPKPEPPKDEDEE